jgi:hypothetical protein
MQDVQSIQFSRKRVTVKWRQTLLATVVCHDDKELMQVCSRQGAQQVATVEYTKAGYCDVVLTLRLQSSVW